MNPQRKPALAMLMTLLVGCSTLTLPMFSQSKQDKKDEQKKQEPQKTGDQKKAEEPAPLFEGKVGLKSSRQGKDSATLGFSGVGPNGEVEQKVLTATPTSTDLQKASEMGNRKVAPDALQLFIVEGQLNPQGAPKSQK